MTYSCKNPLWTRFASEKSAALAIAEDVYLTPSTSQEWPTSMKPKPVSPKLCTARSLILACLLLGSAPAWAADYASLVSQARTQLQNERYIEALAAAKDAVRANPNDYKGHYYLAMAYLGMDRFDDAETAVKRAQTLVQDNARAGVQKLADTIQSRRAGTGSVQAAEAALADGLTGKAARLYDQAWRAGQDNYELGLKAADLYANRLKQPVDAGRVLRQVIQSAKGGSAADRAAGELSKLADTLMKIAQGHAATAARQQGEDALRSLQLAEEADPGYLPIHHTRARLAAQGGDAEALMGAIKELARRDAAKPKTLSNLPNMAQWLEQPAFAEFMTDLLGDTQVRTLRKMASNPVPDNIIRDCDECPEMLVIPDGSFQMGSNQGDSDEKPVHTVQIASFALAKTEVTQGQWRAIMGNNPSRFDGCGDNCPVEKVNWNDAQDYVRKLSEKTGQKYRLPSEAEWEYACRAGGQHQYCGSDSVDSVAWYDGNSGGKTHAVGQKQANAWGLYDMSGNVWEWAEDCGNNTYGGAPIDGSAWIGGDCGKRVVRGGSWNYDPAYSRAADRGGAGTAYRYYDSGFRPARIISP